MNPMSLCSQVLMIRIRKMIWIYSIRMVDWRASLFIFTLWNLAHRLFTMKLIESVEPWIKACSECSAHILWHSVVSPQSLSRIEVMTTRSKQASSWIPKHQNLTYLELYFFTEVFRFSKIRLAFTRDKSKLSYLRLKKFFATKKSVYQATSVVLRNYRSLWTSPLKQMNIKANLANPYYLSFLVKTTSHTLAFVLTINVIPPIQMKKRCCSPREAKLWFLAFNKWQSKTSNISSMVRT